MEWTTYQSTGEFAGFLVAINWAEWWSNGSNSEQISLLFTSEPATQYDGPWKR